MKNNTLIGLGALVAVVLAVLYFRKPAAAAQKKQEGFLSPDETSIVIGVALLVLFVGMVLVVRWAMNN